MIFLYNRSEKNYIASHVYFLRLSLNISALLLERRELWYIIELLLTVLVVCDPLYKFKLSASVKSIHNAVLVFIDPLLISVICVAAIVFLAFIIDHCSYSNSVALCSTV
jgi:hypothetical protein